jgi:hypothetical protein
VRTELSYHDRVAGLTAGVSHTDQSGTHTAALDASTVFDDGMVDTLTGTLGDLITDLEPREPAASATV